MRSRHCRPGRRRARAPEADLACTPPAPWTAGWRAIIIAFAAAVLLAPRSAWAQDPGASVCSDLARRAWTLGHVSGREERLLDACTDTARLLRFARQAGPLELRERVRAMGIAPAPEALHAPGYWASLWHNTRRESDAGRTAVWTGRGLTVATGVNAWGRVGPLAYAVRPVAFWSENRAYVPARSTVPIGFQSPWFPGMIDAPYRFGEGPYARLDPGESWLRFDVARVAVGVSNATQSWGPARLHPLVLGTSIGFPHVFIESSLPFDVGIGTVSGRWIMGRLASSGFAPAHPFSRRRAAVAMAGAFTPRGWRGLEVGGTRFFSFHETPGAFSLENAALPLSGLVKTSSRLDLETNQVASLFARIAPPAAPLEVYGEFFRDDHNYDVRDLIGEPDHTAAWVLGLAWRRHDPARDRVSAFTIERVNARATHLRRVRQQLPMYTHHYIVEGHTQRGMLLGTRAGPGGGAFSAVFDRRGRRSGWSLIGEVVLDAQGPAEGATWLGTPAGHFTAGGTYEWLQRGRWFTLGASLQPGFGDVPGSNLRVTMGVDGRLGGRAGSRHAPR